MGRLCAAIALETEHVFDQSPGVGAGRRRAPGWPRLRVGVNSGEAVLRELGGHGHGAYTLVGDTINTGSRLEAKRPWAVC